VLIILFGVCYNNAFIFSLKCALAFLYFSGDGSLSHGSDDIPVLIILFGVSILQ